MVECFALEMERGARALAARATSVQELGRVLQTLELTPERPVLALIGGAAGLDAQVELLRALRPLFEALARSLEALGAVVVDGGTAAGVMRLMGTARAEVGAAFPLLGVAAEGSVLLPVAKPGLLALRERPTGAVALEAHHTHFLFVPGEKWGDESPWLSMVATALAGSAPSATLLVNGGDVSRRDVALSLQARRPVVVVAGTGRLADELAASSRRPALLSVVELAACPQAAVGLIASLLRRQSHGQV